MFCSWQHLEDPCLLLSKFWNKHSPRNHTGTGICKLNCLRSVLQMIPQVHSRYFYCLGRLKTEKGKERRPGPKRSLSSPIMPAGAPPKKIRRCVHFALFLGTWFRDSGTQNDSAANHATEGRRSNGKSRAVKTHQGPRSKRNLRNPSIFIRKT